MATPGFIFGAPGLPATPQELSDKRKAAYAMISRALARAPKDAGEGLNAIGQALIARSMESEASDAQRAGLAQRQRADAGLAGLLGGAPAAPGVPGAAPADAVTGGAGNFPASLITTESGGNWRAQNNVRGAGGLTGHFGRLQFGQARLQEAAAAGAIPQGTTPQQFMASPELQQRAEQWHFADIDNKIRANGLDRMIGQTINGVPITLDGMRAVAHLGGTGGLQRFIQSGGRYNPADANGTSLLNYLQRHGGGQRAQAPADQLTGGDGMEEAPLIDGRNLPPGDTTPTLQRPAMDPLEAFSAALGPGTSGPNPPLTPVAPIPMAGNQGDMMAQAVPQAAPLAAPVPEPRPAMPAMAQAPMQAPMPVARPNMEPPAAAQRAMAPMTGMSERDRLMLLRDEQSLAPGEAQALRGGLGGGNPVQMVAQALGRPQTPATAPQAPTQAAPAVPAPVASVASALGGQPAPQPQAAPAAGGSAQERVAAALRIVNDPWTSDGTKAVAQQVIQQAMRSPEAVERERLQTEQARLGIEQTRRTLGAPLPNSPEALQAQVRAREAEADRLGIQGQARQRYVLTGALPDQQSESIPAQIRTREQEAQRLGLRPGTPEYQNYALTGRFRDSPELSTTDRKAIMEAEDQVPIIQNTLGQLQRARELNRQAYSGALAGIGAAIGTSGVPGAGLIADPKRAEASREFNQIMSGQAVEQMSAILKGATTDREMAQFKEILGNPSTPPDIRERTIDRMISLAQRQMQLQQNRVQQLRGRDYFRPNGGQPGATPGTPPAEPAAQPGVPQAGAVVRGYRFKGGDPAKQENWERVQ